MTLAEMLDKAVSVEIVVKNDEGGQTRYYIAQDQLDLVRSEIARLKSDKETLATGWEADLAAGNYSDQDDPKSNPFPV